MLIESRQRLGSYDTSPKLIIGGDIIKLVSSVNTVELSVNQQRQWIKESCQTMTKQSMTGIQSQNNSSFESTGLGVWKAYGVGPEKLITCAQLKRLGTPQCPTGLIMLKPFYEPRQQRSRAITAVVEGQGGSTGDTQQATVIRRTSLTHLSRR